MKYAKHAVLSAALLAAIASWALAANTYIWVQAPASTVELTSPQNAALATWMSDKWPSITPAALTELYCWTRGERVACRAVDAPTLTDEEQADADFGLDGAKLGRWGGYLTPTQAVVLNQRLAAIFGSDLDTNFAVVCTRAEGVTSCGLQAYHTGTAAEYLAARDAGLVIKRIGKAE
jgi:hypothetical protein